MPSRIGITCSSGMGQTQAIEKVGRGYVDGVVAAGGLPIVLPSLDPDRAAEVVAVLDGLLLTGGGDVDPARFGAAAEPACGPPESARDAWELALVDAARSGGIPILGICRGIQVLNVAAGGSLIQDLPTHGIDGHDQIERAAHEVHDVAVVAESLLARVVGSTRLRTNTLHHQAIDPAGVGEGLRVTGIADDGVVEGVESADGLVLGVQWHPELHLEHAAHRALFSWVIDPPRAGT